MRRLLALALLISMCGCTFVYDSRNQNSLNIGKAKHAGSTMQDGKFRTGRLIILSFFKSIIYD